MIIINNDIISLRKDFIRIKKAGWIKSVSNGYGAIGLTLEHVLGMPKNNFEFPDYNSIEIKTKRFYSKSYTTLFNCTPEGPHKKQIDYIKEKYGYRCKEYPECKVLSNSCFVPFKTRIGLYHYFQLKIDRNLKKIILLIFDITGKLIDDSLYWSFDLLQEKLYRKNKYMACFLAINKKIQDCEYFKYYDMKIYRLKDFNAFIDLIENGTIRITFKISTFKSGVKKGMTHDHGTGFDIQERDFLKLYDLVP